MSQTKSKSDSNSTKKLSINQLKNMDYMQMIEHYIEYPSKGLKFSFDQPLYSDQTFSSPEGKNVRLNPTGIKRAKTNFVSEQDKAQGWRDNYSASKKNSKFLQTNLHYLPEHLWSRASVYRQDNVDVGMKVSDKSVHFFVHKADTDELTRELFQLVQNKYSPNKERIQQILEVFNEKGIESWLTIRAKSLV